MKRDLWLVIMVVAVFMGFLIGYSLPPMYEVGMIGNKNQQAVGLKSEVNKDMEQYYRELSKDED
jgi:hypothetical protein